MRMYKGKLIGSEEEEQKKVFEWAEYNIGRYPELQLLYHVPNEGKRGRKAAGTLKALGVKKGVPDICLPVRRGMFGALYIELKAKDGKISKDQNRWLHMLNEAGNAVCICYGGDSAILTIEKYIRSGK